MLGPQGEALLGVWPRWSRRDLIGGRVSLWGGEGSEVSFAQATFI